MNKRIVSICIVLALVISVMPSINFAGANPYNFSVPSMKIVSPPEPPNRYENNTVSLEIEAYMLNESPRLQSIYYSLDGGPFVYLDFTILRNSSWGLDRIGYTVGAKVDLESLSEGSHNVIAYSADSNGKVMATSRAFKVDSHYQVTVLGILSPKNITYSTKEIPLTFTVNGEFKNASYQFLPPSPMRGNITGFPIAGNTTLTGLSDGSYRILLYAYADGKGGTRAYLEFTVNSTQANNSLTLDTQTTSTIVMAVIAITIGAAVIAVILIKRKKAQE